MGNANSTSSPFLIGAETAAPVAIEVFDFLTRDSDAWFARPDGVAVRKVCTVSGDKATALCPHTKEDYFLPGVSSEKECTVHKTVWIRKSDGAEVCPYCMKGSKSEYTDTIVETWPPEIASFLRSTGRKMDRIPLHNRECTHFSTVNRPKILSVQEGTVFVINPSENRETQKIPLKAQTAQDVDKIFWFAGSRLIATTLPDETAFFSPQSGIIRLTVLDSRGRSDTVSIKIIRKGS